jgi:hypothetical protein
MRPLVVIHAENGYLDEEFEKAFGRERPKKMLDCLQILQLR